MDNAYELSNLSGDMLHAVRVTDSAPSQEVVSQCQINQDGHTYTAISIWFMHVVVIHMNLLAHYPDTCNAKQTTRLSI
jgi:hypothetical protein